MQPGEPGASEDRKGWCPKAQSKETSRAKSKTPSLKAETRMRPEGRAPKS